MYYKVGFVLMTVAVLVAVSALCVLLFNAKEYESVDADVIETTNVKDSRKYIRQERPVAEVMIVEYPVYVIREDSLEERAEARRLEIAEIRGIEKSIEDTISDISNKEIELSKAIKKAYEDRPEQQSLKHFRDVPFDTNFYSYVEKILNGIKENIDSLEKNITRLDSILDNSNNVSNADVNIDKHIQRMRDMVTFRDRISESNNSILFSCDGQQWSFVKGSWAKVFYLDGAYMWVVRNNTKIQIKSGHYLVYTNGVLSFM